MSYILPITFLLSSLFLASCSSYQETGTVFTENGNVYYFDDDNYVYYKEKGGRQYIKNRWAIGDSSFCKNIKGEKRSRYITNKRIIKDSYFCKNIESHLILNVLKREKGDTKGLKSGYFNQDKITNSRTKQKKVIAKISTSRKQASTHSEKEKKDIRDKLLALRNKNLRQEIEEINQDIDYGIAKGGQKGLIYILNERINIKRNHPDFLQYFDQRLKGKGINYLDKLYVAKKDLFLVGNYHIDFFGGDWTGGDIIGTYVSVVQKGGLLYNGGVFNYGNKGKSYRSLFTHTDITSGVSTENASKIENKEYFGWLTAEMKHNDIKSLIIPVKDYNQKLLKIKYIAAHKKKEKRVFDNNITDAAGELLGGIFDFIEEYPITSTAIAVGATWYITKDPSPTYSYTPNNNYSSSTPTNESKKPTNQNKTKKPTSQNKTVAIKKIANSKGVKSIQMNWSHIGKWKVHYITCNSGAYYKYFRKDGEWYRSDGLATYSAGHRNKNIQQLAEYKCR